MPDTSHVAAERPSSEARNTLEGSASVRSPRLARYLNWLPVPLLTLAVAWLFLTSPHNGDFWWSDAPRHAMDGAFYKDFFRDLPLGHITQYATDYYLQYPALTILFYPPLVPLVEALFYSVFGVSHFTAQLTISFFYLVAALAAYRLCRRWFDSCTAFSISLLFIGLPEVTFWGRQVMLEIPTCALILLSSNVLFSYIEQEKPWKLYLLASLMAACAYTKQTAVFMFPVLALMLWRRSSWRLLRNVHTWTASALLILELLPLVVVTWKYGRVNLDSVAGGKWNDMPVLSWKAWTFYASHFPSQVGWIPLFMATLFFLKLWRPDQWTTPNLFFLVWIVSGYLFSSLIALKDARYAVPILFPLAFFAVQAARSLLPQKLTPWALVLLSGGNFLWSVTNVNVPYVKGYDKAVDYVATAAPRNATILFSGARDGSFIFDMRSRLDRPDLSVLRADKLLLRVTQKRELGLEEKALTESDISHLLTRYGVEYVVTEPGFWNDLSVMRKLQRVLESSQFKSITRVPVSGNIFDPEPELVIYQSTIPCDQHKTPIRVDLPIVGLSVEGTLRSRDH